MRRRPGDLPWNNNSLVENSTIWENGLLAPPINPIQRGASRAKSVGYKLGRRTAGGMTNLSKHQVRKAIHNRQVKEERSRNMLNNAEMATIVASYLNSKHRFSDDDARRMDDEEYAEEYGQEEPSEERIRQLDSLRAMGQSLIERENARLSLNNSPSK